jgi:hypothetical protein
MDIAPTNTGDEIEHYRRACVLGVIAPAYDDAMVAQI